MTRLNPAWTALILSAALWAMIYAMYCIADRELEKLFNVAWPL